MELKDEFILVLAKFKIHSAFFFFMKNFPDLFEALTDVTDTHMEHLLYISSSTEMTLTFPHYSHHSKSFLVNSWINASIINMQLTSRNKVFLCKLPKLLSALRNHMFKVCFKPGSKRTKTKLAVNISLEFYCLE